MRRSWLYLLAIAFGVFALVEGARALPKIAVARVPGVYFTNRAAVTSPVSEDAARAGIAVDDKIVAVDGTPVADGTAIAERVADMRVGAGVTIRVATSAGERDIALTVSSVSLVAPIVAFVISTLFIIFGLAVFWFHPGRREVWAFMFACVIYGATVLFLYGNPRTTQTVLDSRLGLASGALIGPMFVAVFAAFPRPLPIVVRRPVLCWAFIGAAFAFAVATAIAVPRPITQQLRQAVTVLNLVCVVACILSVIFQTSSGTAGSAEVFRTRPSQMLVETPF